ncbi:plasma-membrane choline transporter-domain-containing protein [Stachybotrys elegans]|uniref:Protein PNS1 n=1 Tax=Stachybotrys elegans TaxID=80388 RepID=A0A8K0WXR1_9HYPO|nr:plasma-membrane choline transporter-domain-containing protein [Stachybotrys elegans]
MGEADGYYRGGNQPGYQQQYQQQPYHNEPPPPVPPHPYGGDANAPPPLATDNMQSEKASFEQAFQIQRPKWNDLWAGIVFLTVVAGYIGISAWSLYRYSNTSGTVSYNVFDRQTILIFVVCLGTAFILSFLYVWLARTFTKQFIWITGILNIIWTLGTAVYYLYRRWYSAGIVFLVFGLFLAFCFSTWISRIPFSTLMLQTSIDVSKNYGHVYLVSLLGGILATGLAAWFGASLVAIYVTFGPRDDLQGNDSYSGSSGQVIGLIVFMTFAMYWITEWLKNTIHTTISGVYGSWYFCPHNFPKDATRGSLKRALTTSYGSICFGSLIVAFIQFLRSLCSAARSASLDQGGLAGAISYAVFCILGCLIGLLEWAAEFFNRYAFVHIALYGKAYLAAAKDTWQMIKNRGLDALINDCLIGPVLGFGALAIGVICALVSWLLAVSGTFVSSGDELGNTDSINGSTAVIMAFAFLIGFQIANVFTTPLSSGVDTIFVAMGWDPQVMWRDHPELYQRLVQVYPKVQEVIQH